MGRSDAHIKATTHTRDGSGTCHGGQYSRAIRPHSVVDLGLDEDGGDVVERNAMESFHPRAILTPPLKVPE